MGKTAPQNYLICNGQIVKISDYPVLADYFLSQFGSKNYFGGDGSITFGIPDLRGEFLRGSGTNSHADSGSGLEVGQHQKDGLPNITGTPPYSSHRNFAQGLNGTVSNGALFYNNTKITSSAGSNNGPAFSNNGTLGGSVYGVVSTLAFDASYSNSIYGGSDYVTPPNTSVLYCISIGNY